MPFFMHDPLLSCYCSNRTTLLFIQINFHDRKSVLLFVSSLLFLVPFPAQKMSFVTKAHLCLICHGKSVAILQKNDLFRRLFQLSFFLEKVFPPKKWKVSVLKNASIFYNMLFKPSYFKMVCNFFQKFFFFLISHTAFICLT